MIVPFSRGLLVAQVALSQVVYDSPPAEIGFTRIVFGQGIIALSVWLLLFVLSLALPLCFGISLVMASCKRSAGMCLAGKLLPCLGSLSVLVGIFGSVLSAIRSFAMLANFEADRDWQLAMSISSALWVLLFSSATAIGYILAFIFVVALTHLRMYTMQKRIPPTLPNTD